MIYDKCNKDKKNADFTVLSHQMYMYMCIYMYMNMYICIVYHILTITFLTFNLKKNLQEI